jgi:hypothetical protein
MLAGQARLPTRPCSPAAAQGFHKILKKHDKLLPHAPCQQFYIAHLHHQPWVQARGPAARRRTRAPVRPRACLQRPARGLAAATEQPTWAAHAIFELHRPSITVIA